MAINLGRNLEGLAYGLLNEFLGTFRDGNGSVARPNHYEVVIHTPAGKRAGKSSGDLSNIFTQVMKEMVGSGEPRKIGLRCSQISFPGRSLDVEAEANTFGPARDIVQGFTYSDVSASFQCSTDLKEKQFFETWQRLAFNPQNWQIGYYDNYVGAVDIYQLDEQMNRRHGVQLVEAFPKLVGDISLDYGVNDTFSTVGVTFGYRYWKSLTDEADLPKPLADRLTEVFANTIERQITSQIPRVLSRL